MVITKKRQTLRTADIIIGLIMTSLVLYFIVSSFRNSSIRHAIVLASTAMFYCFSLIRITKDRLSLRRYFSFALVIFVIVVNLLFSAHNYNLEMVYSCLNFISLYIIMTTKSVLFYSDRSLNEICVGAIIIALVVGIVSRSSAAYYFEDGRFNGSLVLGMTNSNVAGMMISSIINILLILLTDKKIAHRILITATIAVLFHYLFLTNCRSAELCSAFVGVYAFFFSKKQLPNWVILAPIIASIAFVPAYLYLYETGLFDVVILGKSFYSGRQTTYREYLSMLESPTQWLFGNFGEALLRNAHNAPLCITCSFGLIGLLVVYTSFARRLLQMNKEANTYYKRMSLVCIMSLFVQSSMEAFMLTGIFPGIAIVFLYTVLFYAKPSDEHQ